MGGGNTKSTSKVKGQDYSKLKNACLKSGELFCDELFELDVENATWLRPHKIVKDPKFFVDGASRFDVVQGANSGCWLLVAMANLTTNPTLFDHVVPKDQSFTKDYAGIFRFNIWQCGKWIEVVVDDRLPTKEDGKLKFTHSRDKNEFWSALLEKAYAKLYGSYNEITVGWFNESMVDFTGGIVERVDLKPPPHDLVPHLKKSFKKSSFMCVFMVNDPSIEELILGNGLVKGHAYSLTKVHSVTVNGKNVLLLRLRNPWGKNEWNGPWSDSSPEWKSISSDEKKEMGLVADNDGEFWMPLSDFLKNFQYIDICHLSPDLFDDDDEAVKMKWESHFYRGEWTKGVTAGGISMETLHLNPQYRITLTETDEDSEGLCTVLIGLLQKNKSRKVWHRIGFTAYHLEGPEKNSKKPLSNEYLTKNFENSNSCRFREHREVVVRDAWEPGVYCIIPSTYKPNKEGQYLLRFYSEKKASMEESPQDAKIGMTPVEEIQSNQIGKVLPASKGIKLLKKNDKEMFDFFQEIAGDENEIGWEGLQSILDYALTNSQTSDAASTGFIDNLVSLANSLFFGSPETQLFTKAECRNIISIMDDDQSGRLSFREFKLLWRKMQALESVFQNHSNGSSLMNSADLRLALQDVGYNIRPMDFSRLVRKYSGEDGQLEFDDFVMCAVDLYEPDTS